MNDVLAPFHASRTSRLAHISRSNTLHSLLHAPPRTTATVITLPNLEAHASRPTGTFVVRPLSSREKSTLVDSCACRLLNDDVRVMYRVAGNGEGSTMKNWDVSSSLVKQIRNCTFGSNVILGVLLDGPDVNSSSVRIGVSNVGFIQNCILEPGCGVHNTTELYDTHVMKYATIRGCGSVTCTKEVIVESRKKCHFDVVRGSMDIEVGPEAGGGRVVSVNIESTLVDVCHDLNMDSNGGTTMAPLMNKFDSDNDTTAPSSPTMNLLCSHSSVLHTPQVSHVHLCPHSTIDSATSVTSCILLPQSTIRHGCTVSHALLQWSSAITSQSDAHRVFLMERSEVGPHSFTANAIYGPDSHVSGGEVHCTLFGPNANSHHQSLLIGILWPLGRGNVGYGSNVGSNHTGRIPDQETSVGEGTFWGLGSVIKFPVDLTSAPYSIVAAGVQLPPQRISMPFSLITDGPNGNSGGTNQLTPGWLLQYSPYTIARSEVKFANRRTAKRHDYYTGWKILRPGMMDLLMSARGALLAANVHGGQSSGEGKAKNNVYKGDRDIVGLGANMLTEKGRQIGIRAYTDAIQRYALRGLLERLVRMVKENKTVSLDEMLVHTGLTDVNVTAVESPAPSDSTVEWPVLPWNEPSHADEAALWKHQHSTLLKEIPSIVNGSSGNILSQLLQKCSALEDDHAKRVYKSKSRDDSRGASTVPGYKDSHIPAEKDSVVLAATKEAGQVKNEVKMVLAACGADGAVRSRL